jgi:hypothetical protein
MCLNDLFARHDFFVESNPLPKKVKKLEVKEGTFFS